MKKPKHHIALDNDIFELFSKEKIRLMQKIGKPINNTEAFEIILKAYMGVKK